MKNIYYKILISISVLGAFFSGFGYNTTANMMWGVSNPLLAYNNYKNQNIDNVYLFSIFTIAAWINIIMYMNSYI